jgi:TPR repeat protein
VNALLLAMLLAVTSAGVAPAGVAQRPGLLRAEAAVRADDDAAALQLLEPLAAKGDKRAEYRLGQVYEQGLALPRDPARALRWYERSARQAYTPAERRLAMLYLEGRLVPQDYDRARQWLERAAHDGSARAQLALADLLRKGLNRAPDPIMAYVWYDFAAAGGNIVARRSRDQVAKTLTPAQLEEAQRTAQAIAPSVHGAGADASRSHTDGDPTQERTLAPACGCPGLRACRDDQLHAACLLQDATSLRCTSS